MNTKAHIILRSVIIKVSIFFALLVTNGYIIICLIKHYINTIDITQYLLVLDKIVVN